MESSMKASIEFLDLPQEIQDRIYDKYFDNAEATISFTSPLEASSAIKIRIQRIPSLALESACRKMRKDSLTARNRSISTHVNVQSAKNISKSNLLIQMAENPRLAWFREHITSLKLNDESNMSMYPLDWRPFLNSFHKLSMLRFSISRTVLTDRDHQELTDAILSGALDKSMADKAIFAPRLNSLAVALEEKLGADAYTVISETTIFFWNCYYSEALWKKVTYQIQTKECFLLEDKTNARGPAGLLFVDSKQGSVRYPKP